MGFAECHGTSANLAAVVSEADKMLYEEKNRKHVKDSKTEIKADIKTDSMDG